LEAGAAKQPAPRRDHLETTPFGMNGEDSVLGRPVLEDLPALFGEDFTGRRSGVEEVSDRQVEQVSDSKDRGRMTRSPWNLVAAS